MIICERKYNSKLCHNEYRHNLSINRYDYEKDKQDIEEIKSQILKNREQKDNEYRDYSAKKGVYEFTFDFPYSDEQINLKIIELENNK